MDNATATILIVDDDVVNRRVLEGYLESSAYETLAAASGEEALQVCARQVPDLILLDVMMPGMSGFEVAERLKGDDVTRNVPIIMITALGDRESRLTALGNGAEDFLTKPVDSRELVVKVRNLLRLKKHQDMLAGRGDLLEARVSERNVQLAAVSSRLSEAEGRLAQSERLAAIGQLAAGVAHEINTPVAYVNTNLCSLEGYLDDLFRIFDAYALIEEKLPAQAREKVEVQRLKKELDYDYLRTDARMLVSESKEGISAVRRIVEDLKDFSRSDMTRAWKLADLHKGLNATLNVAHNEIKYKADVLREYGAIPEIECLPAKLNQVFLNLLVNAAHAIPEGRRGKITLRTGADADEVWVEVSDTGCGIAPENVQRIFDPFFTTKPEGVGTGLGLSLSYGIVRQHTGRIEVTSAVGQGSTFRVTLPIRQSPAAEGPAAR